MDMLTFLPSQCLCLEHILFLAIFVVLHTSAHPIPTESLPLCPFLSARQDLVLLVSASVIIYCLTLLPILQYELSA